jgi:hypothetical protein
MIIKADISAGCLKKKSYTRFFGEGKIKWEKDVLTGC